MTGKTILIAPFWNHPGHLSAVRTERYIRWLAAIGHEVLLVRAGEQDAVMAQPWGKELIIRDPLKLHPEDPNALLARRSREYPAALARIASVALCPDACILWGRRAASHPLLLDHGSGADRVVSTSPPESAHLTAARVAARFNARLVVDMRDGWLDEPLKPGLTQPGLTRWREGRMERQVLARAETVLVTSPEWKRLLEERHPRVRAKVGILRNCYPIESRIPPSARPDDSIELLYAGQFTRSKFNNRADLLLSSLHAGASRAGRPIRIHLQGHLNAADRAAIETWAGKFAAIGCEVGTLRPVSRDDLIKSLPRYHGLLLISATKASILAKLIDYLPSARPIFALTPRGSAIWNLAPRIRQMFLLDTAEAESGQRVVDSFLDATVENDFEADLPEEFSEDHNREIFYQALGLTH